MMSRNLGKHLYLAASLWITAAVAAGKSFPVELPDTGIIRHYNWTITRGFTSPDGVNKSALLVNNVFPGPLLEANWGDTFHITVTNSIKGPSEGTLLHWHGLLQQGTPWADGVPAVGMCPIAPTKSYTYKFRADSYGTSWWHSHYSAQLVDGLMGPMVIHGPKHTPYDIDLGPVLLSDNFHQEYHKYIEMSSGIPFNVPISDSNLINGKMRYDCSKITTGQNCVPNSPLSKFEFQPGKIHRLRLINAGAEGLQYFTIDKHIMTVIANDFIPVQPYQTEVVILGIGQRTDILVNATGKVNESYWMRSNISSICSPAFEPNALAEIHYPESNRNVAPQSIPDTEPFTQSCGNTPLESTIPYFAIPPILNPTTTAEINLTLGTNSSGNTLFFMNGQSFRGNYDHPTLLLAKLGNISYPNDPQWNVYNFGSNESVRIILNNMTPLSHPIHLHGHNFDVVAEGSGFWNGTLQNSTQRRDVQLMPGGSPETPTYLVIQFLLDNPGVWPLHCHIAWHVSTGLYVNVLSRPKDIEALEFPSCVAQTCRDWSHFTNHTIVDQIDSGL